MKRTIVVLGFVAACGLTLSPSWALFESNKTLSDQARISMTEAIKTAEQTTQGKAVEVSMGKDDGRPVYKIETIDGSKKSRKVYIDAMDGKIHEVK